MCSLSIGACATTDPLLIDLSTTQTKKVSNGIEGCTVFVGPIVDERTSLHDLGSLGGQVVHGKAVVPWVQQSIDTLSSLTSHRDVLGENRHDVRRIDIEVLLKQLYVHSLHTSMGANVLLIGRYRINQGPTESHAYRGTETSVNWTGSESSIRNLFETVMEDALAQMRKDLVKACQSP